MQGRKWSLALECPTNLLELVQPLADYDFILAQEVNSDKEYARFYSNSQRLKILDNGTNEKKVPCSLDDLKRAYELVKPEWVVSPDYPDNYMATITSLGDSIKAFGQEKVMPVLQVHDITEAVRCLRFYLDMGFKRVSVPCDICGGNGKSNLEKAMVRSAIVEVISQMGFEWVHLLGMNTLEELTHYNNNPIVSTLDTGVPVLCGMRGIRFGYNIIPNKGKPTLEGMQESVKDYDLNLIEYNVRYIKEKVWIRI